MSANVICVSVSVCVCVCECDWVFGVYKKQK